MARTVLIYNAGAGSADEAGVDRIVAALKEHGVDPEVRELGEGDNPVAAAKAVVADGFEVILAAGGDGTIEAVAAELIGRNVTFGAIACGTYNNFARSAGLPLEPEEACAVIGRGMTREIDVGFANGQAFFECAGFGLDAEIFPLGEEIKSGAMAKWFALLGQAFRYRRQRFVLEFDRPLIEALGNAGSKAGPGAHRVQKRLSASKLSVKALLLTVSNGPYYGMNFAVAPDARVDDGILTVSIFRKFSHWELWWHFASIASGRRAYSPKMLTLRVGSIRVDGPRRVRVHLDGREMKAWPVEIELRRGALRLFA